MEKINVAQLIKDCPQGMELDCTIFENLEFDSIEENNGTYLIICRVKTEFGYNVHVFTEQGCYSSQEYSKCVIFPKGKTTWEEFVPPCQFKDGDVVATTTGNWIGITEGGTNDDYIPTYCVIKSNGEFEAYFGRKGKWCFDRLATEEEKQKLFQAIKDNGYRWNPETKTLEKLIEPKFKVGDKVRHKNNHNVRFTITNIEDDSYVCGANLIFCFDDQDNYELVPNKFDINTLVPFESRVLVRNSDSGFWKPAFWGIYEAEKSNEHQYRNYLTTEGFVRHCIPYNDETKHLVGKTCDCPEYYKTWEE